MTSPTTTADVDEVLPFSQQVRIETTTDHSSAEHSVTMTKLVNGELTLAEYIDMQAQLAFVYDALETAVDQLADDPLVGEFADECLRRIPSLRQDLEALGLDSLDTVTPTGATDEYVARIKGVAREWPLGIVAHHYTRYLGDLSGGQYIRRVVEKTYGIDSESGTAFFHFADIDNVNDYKESYRARLDSLPIGANERRRFIEEVSTSYALNMAMFRSFD